MFERRQMLRTALLAAMCAVGWLLYLVISLAIIVTEPQRSNPQLAWQYDWHVYLGGTRDLIDRSLYREPLTLDSFPLPVSEFNLPPMSAATALPLAPFDPELGGNIWLGLMVASIAVGVALATAVLGAKRPVLFAGIGLLAYTVSPWFTADILLGNNNGLTLPLVAGFVLMHLRGRQRAAGLLLGIAISFKPWPLALLPLLVREGAWREIRWAAVFLVAQGVVFLGWLGVDVVPSMVAAITSPVPIEPGVPVLGWTFLRQSFGLPGWIGVVAGILLLAIPARGRVGLGIAILAGLTLMVPNLWQHYLPVVVLGVALLLVPLVAWVWDTFVLRRLPAVGP